MQKTVLSSEYLSSYGSLKILGQLLGGGTLVGGGGRGCEISPHCPHSRPPTPLLPSAPLHFLNIHSPTTSITITLYNNIIQYSLPSDSEHPTLLHRCVLEPDKHRAKGGVLGLAGCALLIGVLIEGITNTYWVQIPSATLPTICPEP